LNRVSIENSPSAEAGRKSPASSNGLSRLSVRSIVAFCIGICSVSIGVTFVHSRIQDGNQVVEAADSRESGSMEPIQPIEVVLGLDSRKTDLGRKLFHEPQLSRNSQISCASCHDLHSGGADHKARSIGINGTIGFVNAPTVFNSGFNFKQFWDGRADTLEQQIDGPLQAETEMGSSWPEVVSKLKHSPEYVHAFRAIYRDDIQSGHIKDAIAVFERSLTTPNSRFDQYLRHVDNALTKREQQGYQLFKSLGCASCHQGVNVGGNMYQKMGVLAPYFGNGAKLTRADRGRFNVTGDPQDMYMFKVPSLRNVALTAPYFHDGSAPALIDAVRIMAKYQLGHRLADCDMELIVEFLKTLTGELDGHPL
jgi:cytochrome c peroxidase